MADISIECKIANNQINKSVKKVFKWYIHDEYSNKYDYFIFFHGNEFRDDNLYNVSNREKIDFDINTLY